MIKRSLIHIFLVLIISAISIVSTSAQDPFIPKYDAVKRSERCFTVTWETYNQFGAVWWADKVDFSSDTLFNFVVYMGDRDGNGADGLAFVMHQDPRDTITDPSQQVIIGGAGTWDLQAATGDDGGGLGYAMHLSREGPNTIPGPHGPGDDPENHKIQKSVAVEMDTWNNNDVPDGNNGTDANGVNQNVSQYFGWDHTSVVYNGDIYGGQQVITDGQGNSNRILPLKPGYAYGTGNNPDGSVYHNIEDDRCYLFQIRWEVNPDGTQTLQLWGDVYNGTTNTDGLQMVMTHTDDMINNVFDGDPVMRFGFTGSTGGSINEQTICLLGENLKPFAQDDYASIPLNATAIIDVESNDNDPDGDELYVPIIIDQASNGLADIFDSLDVNYMRYTPNTNFVGLDTISYVTCDVNSTKCYAKCDTALVYINVGCLPFDVDLTATSPNNVCSDAAPANGSASANVNSSLLRGTLWYEGFEDLSNGTTNDNGTSSWTSTNTGSCNGGNQIEVENNRFRVRNSGCDVRFETGIIDLSGLNDVGVTIDLESQGGLESSDYLRVYYILDGGAETIFTNGMQEADFGIAQANINGLSGSTLQIVVLAKNDGGDENYYWDNVHVTAVGAGVPNVTYNWYNGAAASGPIIYTGPVINSVSQGVYSVIAIDNITGCPSNPASITIDSTGYQIPGAFIEQLSPFTNCKLPYDGALGAGVLDGSDTLTIGYTFEWYHQEDPKIPSFIQRNGPIAQNLESREYTVVITEASTGCDTSLNAEVINAVNIPLVTANKIADVTSCIDPNSGIGDANVAGVTDGFRFEWYTGPAIGAGPPDFTGSTVNTFPVGTFTVQAIDSLTFCPSDPASISIVDLTDKPVLLVTGVSEQMSCDTLAPTGQLSGAVDVSGTPTTSGYSFNWYRGPNDIIPARAGYTGGPTADSLIAASYRLVVVEDGTNCTSFIDTLIQDLTTSPPDISVSTVDVTHCTIPNGSITATVVGNPVDYIFDIYNGFGAIADSLLLTSNSNIISDLAIGNYTVVARDIITKCESSPVTATINDGSIAPTTTIISDDQVSCDLDNPTGQLTASMGFGDVNDYTFDWFNDDLSGTPIVPSGIGENIISGLDSGNYALNITNNTTQCTIAFYPSVNIGIVLPIESVSATPSTFCGNNANGQLIATVDGGLTEVDGYTFIWESVANGDTLATSTATVTSIAPGDFILTVISDATTCASNPAPVTVDDNTVIPNPVLSTLDNSSCEANNPNGQITVTSISNEADPFPGGYNFTWYEGNSSGNQLVSPNVSFPLDPDSSQVLGLSAGTYALVMTNSTTSCSNEVLSVINDINIKPIIDGVSVTNATDCSTPFMSGASITTVNGGNAIPAGYTFEWTNMDGGPTISETGSQIANMTIGSDTLPPGNYQVIAYNAYNCPSDPVIFEIKDNSLDPVFTIDATPNTSCTWIPSNTTTYSNGTLAVNYGGPNSITNYNWERETPLGSGNWVTFGGDNQTVAGLHELDNYRVLVVDDRQCSSINYASITKINDQNPFIEFASVKDVDNCGVPNGELEVQVTFGIAPPAGFDYEYSLTGPVNSNQTGNGLFQSLSVGSYQAVVTNTFTQCVSNTIDTAINVFTDLQFTINANPPSSCTGVQNGSIDISGTSNSGLNEGPSTGPGFTYVWFVGNDKTSPVPPGNVNFPDAWSSQAINLGSNNYTIEITDLSTSCSIDTTVFLPASTLAEFFDPAITNSTQCIPGNGEVELQIDPATFGIKPGPVTADYSDYEYILFEGNAIDATWTNSGTSEYAYIAAGGVPALGPVIFSGLDLGIYTVIAKEAFNDNCLTDTKTFTIELDYTFDPLVFTEIQPDNTCLTLTGNGQLGETNNAFYTTGGEFEYTWFSGLDISDVSKIVEGPTNTTKLTPDTLRAGQYTLAIEIIGGPVAGLGCKTSGVANLSKQVDELIVAAAPVNPITICSYGNGDIFISEISENGTNLGNTLGYGNFMLYDSVFFEIGAANAGNGIAGTSWNLLNEASYFVTAQNLTTLCITNPLKVDVKDISENPVITVSIINPDYSCDGLTPTGVLEASANGSQITTDYNFEWEDPLGVIVSDNPNSFSASDLSANNAEVTYTITVEDISADLINDGCISTRDFTLVHQATSVYLLDPQLTVNPQTICAPNGSMEVNNIFEFDPFTNNTTSESAAYIMYGAQLLESDLSISPASYGTFNQATGFFDDGSGNTDVIPAGIYYVRAQNLSTGCAYGPLTQKIVLDESKKPIVSASLDSPDYSCVGGAATGELTPIIFGGTDNDDGVINPANFTVTWVKDDGSIPTTDDGGGTWLPRAINLDIGTYTMQVTDESGNDQFCISSRDYVVTAAKQDIDITASASDQTICIPDGSIQLETISVDGNPVVLPNAGWNVVLMDNSNNAIIPAPPETGFSGDPFANIFAGSYFVLAQDDLTKCYSDPYQVVVNDLSENPVIDIDITNPQYSLNQNPASWTGAMQANVSEIGTGMPDPGGYNYAWVAGIDGGGPLLSGLDNVSSVDQGYYTFVAANIATGCESSYYKYMPFVYLEPTFNTLTSPLTICSPTDGSIDVTDIALAGTPDLLSDYTFNWHHDMYESGDVPDAVIPGNDVRTAYENIGAGGYYIIAQENWWMIDSYPVKVEVIDSTTNPIIIFDATNYQAVMSCDQSILADGALTVDVFEDNSNPYLTPPFNYGYTWYEGNTSDPANIIADSISNSISGMQSGNYTIVVVNLDNNCQSENTFTIDDESITPIVIASQTPNTNCPIEIANGVVSANVINSTNSYSYVWFNGDEAVGSPDYLGAIWRDRALGFYTVVATDQNLSTCISEPVAVEVMDATVLPTVLINEISPVTNCDPTRPNGVLSATTQDGINGHTFTWYLDGSLYASGPIASNLGLFKYQIVVINDVTQCETTMESGPTQLLSAIPPPEVDVLNDRSSCIEPDGIATASISGNVTDYIFKYFNKFSGDELNNFYEDYKIYDLDTSTYFVIAEDRTTGCISDPTEFVIEDGRYFPEIEVIVDPSNCQNPSGAANVILSDMTQDFKVSWYGENGYFAQEKELVYIPIGKYRVDVEGTDGCVTSAEAEIKGDIIIYNGVSANFDGLNDFFQIVCLEYFPDNNVKIYNRGGLLVYEQDFYNMNDMAKRFEGVSNKGASVIGTELPIGTYFYVVDKSDGSKAKVGYLELNR